MKFAFALLLSFFFFASNAQTKIPEGTQVNFILKEDVNVSKYKVGSTVPFVVADDVKIKGTVVIPANAAVHAVVTSSSKPAPHKGEGELRIDVLDVMDMSGATIKLNDCWLYTTGAENLKGHTAQFVKGTRKNCTTKN
jgi:hypothetical protein